ncbi:hypothetical protein GOBAR_DD06240 [Gossypium barbadense]|nr:hypothetical protein GOBAR_DD06240 [Gossypium barbadense]
MDGPNSERSTNLLKFACCKLGHFYAMDESYWAQRDRIQWLKEGDRNTRYFHVRATGHSHGTCHEDKKEVCNIALSYFNDLFKTTIASCGDVDLYFIPECFTNSMNSSLNREFTDKEISAAFKHMEPCTAPGVDRLSGSFFKEHWSTVGNDVLRLCHDILKGNKDVACINETLLVMIPKLKNPCEMTNFRPISLIPYCNSQN